MDRERERRPALVGYLLNSCLSSVLANWIWREPESNGAKHEHRRNTTQIVLTMTILSVIWFDPLVHALLALDTFARTCAFACKCPSAGKSANHRWIRKKGDWSLFLDAPSFSVIYCSNTQTSVVAVVHLVSSTLQRAQDQRPGAAHSYCSLEMS